MWPYWLDGRAAGTVRNSFALGSMALLTGAAQASDRWLRCMRVNSLRMVLKGACYPTPPS